MFLLPLLGLLTPDPGLAARSFTPPKLTAPVRARYTALGRTLTDDFGTELWVRAGVDVHVEPTRGGGAAWSREETLTRIIAQTDFGLVGAEQLQPLLKPPTRLRWEVAKDGAVVFDAGSSGAGVGEIGSAPAALLGFVAPPSRAVAPGDSWPRVASLHQDAVVDGEPVRFDLVVHARDRFEGWVPHEGRSLPLFRTEGSVELTVVVDGRWPGGGVVRIRTQTLLDPDDGLPVWTAAETRLVLTHEGSSRPTVVQGWAVSTRDAPAP